MPVETSFSLPRQEDATITVVMTPPVSITGWPIQFNFLKRFGGDPLFSKYLASGFNGVSGISIVDAGQGVFNVSLEANNTSGFQPGNYAVQTFRLSSGARTELTCGFATLDY